MKGIAATLSILSLVFGGLPLFRHTSRATLVLLLPKYLGTSLALYVALAGALGAALGLAYGSGLAIVAGTIGARLLAARAQGNRFAALYDRRGLVRG